MNCYYHPEVPSVATCLDCQKGLCVACASRYELPICDACNERRKKNTKKIVYKEWLISAAIGILFVLILNNELSTAGIGSSGNIVIDLLYRILSFYLGASIVAGWLTLSRLTSNVFLFLPIIGWLIYFTLKLSLAFTIGWVILPFRTWQNIKLLRPKTR